MTKSTSGERFIKTIQLSDGRTYSHNESKFGVFKDKDGKTIGICTPLSVRTIGKHGGK